MDLWRPASPRARCEGIGDRRLDLRFPKRALLSSLSGARCPLPGRRLHVFVVGQRSVFRTSAWVLIGSFVCRPLGRGEPLVRLDLTRWSLVGS